MQWRSRASALAMVAVATVATLDREMGVQGAMEYATKSGIRTWVDPETPKDRQVYTNSRGGHWELVMSDEFNRPNRSFRPGDDHLWTSLEKPDGVNAALELFSHNMTSTACDDDGTCYYYIKVVDEVNTLISIFWRLNRMASYKCFTLVAPSNWVRSDLGAAVVATSVLEVVVQVVRHERIEQLGSSVFFGSRCRLTD